MATKHVIALRAFYDREAGVNRAEGEAFDVTAQRMEQLNACGPEQCGQPLVKEARAKRTSGKADAE